MPRMTAGDAIVEVMRRAGITRTFGVPGESFMGVLDAIYDAPMEFIATRHEGGASAMASGARLCPNRWRSNSAKRW